MGRGHHDRTDSESDGEIVEASRAGAYASLERKAAEVRAAQQPKPPAEKKKKKRKKRHSGLASGENVFDLSQAEVAPPPETSNVRGAAAPAAAAAPPHPQKKARPAASPRNTTPLRPPQTPGHTPHKHKADAAPPDFRALQLPVAAFSLPVPAATAAAAPGGTPPSFPAPPEQPRDAPPADDAPRDFRRLKLPIASFSLPVPGADPPSDADTPRAPSSPGPDEQPPPPPPPVTLPAATPAHRLWQEAVVATHGHDRYARDFGFARARQYEASAGISDPGDWIDTSARPHGPWCASHPAAIAMDCEMCQTKCPATGSVNNKALCRLSVVNADDPAEVLIDTLVKPEWPVTDHRTWVNGITKADLEGVAFTMAHAMTFMRALCSDQTVVVGHAVHNDLLALRMVHHCNVDTALLFVSADGTDGSPSLKNLAHGALRREMPDVHDSVNDSRVALECARHWVDRKGAVDPVEKVFKKSRHHGGRGVRGGEGRRSEGGGGDADPAAMLVHRLPPGTLPAHISDMFLAYTCIKPKTVPDIGFAGAHGKCVVEFPTKEHAELAYASLVGGEREDKGGNKQKRVGLKGGGYVCVRKPKKGK